MATCRRHPKEPAGWHCPGCKADLCPDCVTRQPGGPRGRQLAVCCACGSGVKLLTMHRRAAQPFGKVLARAFDFPLGSTGIISMAFVGFVRALTSYGGGMYMSAASFAVRQGLYWALIFFTVRGVASGQRRMGVFDFSDVHADLVGPAVKGIFSTAILWIPAFVYIYMAADDGLAGLLTYPAYRDPTVWMLALLGGLYAPMALLAAATDLGYGHILNPVFIGQTVFRIGRDYFFTAVAAGLVLLVGAGMAALIGTVVQVLPIPFLGRWIEYTVGVYPAFVAAGMLGALLYVHGEVLDWGRAEDYEVPLLRGVEPRGQPRPRWDQTHEPAPFRPVSVPVPADGRPAQVQPLAAALAGPDEPESLLNLSQAPSAPARMDPDPAPSPAGLAPPLDLPLFGPPDDKPPSLLNFAIDLPAAVLAADGLLAPAEPSAVDLPPARAEGPVSPSAMSLLALSPPGAVSPSAVSLAAASAPPPAPPPAPLPSAPVTAFVEPRPGPLNIQSAPTVHGFSTALLPKSTAPATVVGHQAAVPPPEGKKTEG